MVFEKHFKQATDKEYTLCTDICDALKEEGLRANHDLGNFYDWLRDDVGLDRDDLIINGRQRRVVYGMVNDTLATTAWKKSSVIKRL
jgi:hypothetical protein